MDTIFSVYKQLKVKEVTYEKGDYYIMATCEIIQGDKITETKIQMTHTDLNRIIARIAAMGYEFKIEHVNCLDFGNGTEIIDYKFENVFGELITLEEFNFNQRIRQIRA
ncbi:MAG: hypothetical protein HUJ25_02625 [Crocinitomicaceae bacterium]|nr:hypothetical protein [Crocinitomicaceae bacterium]